MSLLLYSPRCKHSTEVIEYIQNNPQLKQLVHYHNVNTQGIPPAYKNKINRVPTLLTKNGKLLVGNEIRNWLDSLLPNKELTNWFPGGTCSMTTLDDNENDSDIFLLDQYGQSLQPAMTRDLEEKINRDVSKGVAYNQDI
jgi:hypothetical protein